MAQAELEFTGGSGRPDQEPFRRVVRRELHLMLELALPIIVAEVGWMSMGIVDTVMVGRLPDSAIAIGAVALGSVLYYTVAIFGSGLLLGMDTLVSQAFGRKEHDEVNRSLFDGVFLALVLSPILMGIVWLWEPIVALIGIDRELVREMAPFLRALNWSTPPLLIYFAVRRYLQAVNLPGPVTFALVSANAVNALGNWALIYGHMGAAGMGVTGSAWSTFAARIYMALVLLIAVAYYNRRKHLGIGRVRWRLEITRFRNLLALGLPAAVQILLEVGVFSAATALCGKLGPVPLAGHQIAMSCGALTYMVPLGISSAAAVRVGQNIGARDFRGAKRAGWTATLLGAAFMSASGLTFAFFRRPIARAFTPDQAIIDSAAALLLIAAIFQLFDGLQTVITGALRGAGNTRTPMLVSGLAYWIIGLPVGWFLGFRLGFGARGIWIGLCAALIIIGTALVVVWNQALEGQQSAIGNQRSAISN